MELQYAHLGSISSYIDKVNTAKRDTRYKSQVFPLMVKTHHFYEKIKDYFSIAKNLKELVNYLNTINLVSSFNFTKGETEITIGNLMNNIERNPTVSEASFLYFIRKYIQQEIYNYSKTQSSQKNKELRADIDNLLSKISDPKVSSANSAKLLTKIQLKTAESAHMFNQDALLKKYLLLIGDMVEYNVERRISLPEIKDRIGELFEYFRTEDQDISNFMETYQRSSMENSRLSQDIRNSFMQTQNDDEMFFQGRANSYTNFDEPILKTVDSAEFSELLQYQRINI
jgi:hypothetical protein